MAIKRLRGNNIQGSSYFLGRYNMYGLYQWCIKYYNFQEDWEIEAAQEHCFNQEYLDELLGYSNGCHLKYHIDGRSGGWFVVDEKLSLKDLRLLDDYIEACLESLPLFLAEERNYREDEAKQEYLDGLIYEAQNPASMQFHNQGGE